MSKAPQTGLASHNYRGQLPVPKILVGAVVNFSIVEMARLILVACFIGSTSIINLLRSTCLLQVLDCIQIDKPDPVNLTVEYRSEARICRESWLTGSRRSVTHPARGEKKSWCKSNVIKLKFLPNTKKHPPRLI